MTPQDSGHADGRRWRRYGYVFAATASALALLTVTVALTDFRRVRAGGNATAAAVGCWVADYWWVFAVVAVGGLVGLAAAHAVAREGRALRLARTGWLALGVLPPCAAAAATWWAAATAG